MRYEAKLLLNVGGRPDLNISAQDFNISVSSFSVDGGAAREVSLNSTDDISISSEFEQARMYKSINFNIPPTKDFMAVKLAALRPSGNIVFFSLTFVVTIYNKKVKTSTLRLEAAQAWFKTIPSPLATTPPVLLAPVHFHEANLLYGHYDVKNKEMTYDEI